MNGQSRHTFNIGHKTQNEDKQNIIHRKKTKKVRNTYPNKNIGSKLSFHSYSDTLYSFVKLLFFM
jgi:hypothetical protein